jgi:dCTP deaminase
MSFWSGETLLDNLPNLIDCFTPNNVDCNSYTLTIGPEVYVSPTDETPDPKSCTKRLLAKNESFTIPPGQFAFLLTEEIVRIPPNAFGLISIKAKIKFRGLVNVSGFHVDPGFRGRLIYSVYNAGPATIHLQRGEQCFLIWYASLDRTSEKIKKDSLQDGIPPQLINGISGELQSLEGLSKKIGRIERQQAIITTVAMVIFAAVIAALVHLFLNWSEGPITQTTTATSSATVSSTKSRYPSPTQVPDAKHSP